jgi:hypothetical protein
MLRQKVFKDKEWVSQLRRVCMAIQGDDRKRRSNELLTPHDSYDTFGQILERRG